ncbi:MAG: flagellar biosynthesis protein FlhF [SAR324 cluster bacterium]|nr:flagellar biosynthesis protein FlhF [SAR324 cluster bacterium]
MNLKRYRVNNIQEALQQIKKDLGPDAIIVSTRQVKDGGGTFGLFGKSMLEVTAARDETAKKAPAPPVPRQNNVESSPYGAPDVALATKPKLALESAFKSQEEVQRMLLPIRQEIQELKDIIVSMETRPSRKNQATTQLHHEISEVRTMVQGLAAQSSQLRNEDLSENLVVLFQQMVFNGLEEKFARRLIQEAKKSIPPEELNNFPYVKIFIARMLMKIVRVSNGIQKDGAKQKIVTLIGPTGVGKTTTIAKIASEQVLKYKRKVALLTVDTFRIGAIEQLRSYAKIMNVPLEVTSSKSEINQAIEKFSDYDVILIDTGGRSQRDEAQMYELRELLENNNKRIENFLVLSTTTKDHEISEITRKFGELSIDGVIFTKLDESTTYGCIFNHVIRFKKPIAFLTTGQKVPEDIEIATKERLVDLLLNIAGN